MRVQVNLSDEMVTRVDKYADMMGVSRSALCSMFIGQGIMAYDKSISMLENVGERVGNSLLAEQVLKECGEDFK